MSNFASCLVDFILKVKTMRLAFGKSQLFLFVPNYLRALLKFNSSMNWYQLLVALEGSGVAVQSVLSVPEELIRRK